MIGRPLKASQRGARLLFLNPFSRERFHAKCRLYSKARRSRRVGGVIQKYCHDPLNAVRRVSIVPLLPK